MKIFSFAIALSLASFVAATAHADEPVAPEPAAPTTTWYGYQPLITDVLAMTFTAAGALKGLSEIGHIDLCGSFSSRQDNCPSSQTPDHSLSTALLVSGVVTYGFASPTIHAIHGHWDKAALSLGLRAAPMALAVPLMASGNDDVQRVGAGVLLTGIVAAMVIDDVWLAREPNKAPASTPRAFTLAPTFDARNGGGGLAAAGTF